MVHVSFSFVNTEHVIIIRKPSFNSAVLQRLESSSGCQIMSFKNVSRLSPMRACLSSSRFLYLSKSKTGLRNNFIGIRNTRSLHTCSPLLKKQEVSIVIERGDKEITAKGKEGDSILDVVVNNDIDLGGYGACEGTLSCSTCHIILTPENFSKIPEKASDEELDMLDLAPDVCGTSRLGCQVYLSKHLEGLRVKVPSEIKDQRELPGTTSSVKS